jgi:hypothetical protein
MIRNMYVVALPTWIRDTGHDVAIDTHNIPFYVHVTDTPAAEWICKGKYNVSTTQHYPCVTASVLTHAVRDPGRGVCSARRNHGHRRRSAVYGHLRLQHHDSLPVADKGFVL